MEGDPSYWPGRLRRERRPSSCIKNVWLDKGSQTEKGNQDLTYGGLRQVREEGNYEWI